MKKILLAAGMMVALAACDTGQEEDFEEFETDVEMQEPAPAPMPADTMGMDTMGMDTMGMDTMPREPEGGM
ncbi:MAG: hypothetical protein ACOCVZ_02130 [Gemmatimonadota bacterium]